MKQCCHLKRLQCEHCVARVMFLRERSITVRKEWNKKVQITNKIRGLDYKFNCRRNSTFYTETKTLEVKYFVLVNYIVRWILLNVGYLLTLNYCIEDRRTRQMLKFFVRLCRARGGSIQWEIKNFASKMAPKWEEKICYRICHVFLKT